MGTGQALDVGRRGDADVVFVHDPDSGSEIYGRRARGGPPRLVMYNDFILIGPTSDSGKGRRARTSSLHLQRVEAAKAPFVSRGDRSGTHAAELRSLEHRGGRSQIGKGTGTRETGSGMGPALNTAASMNAYILADRGTWLSFKNRGESAIVVEGDKRLFNQYGA